MSTQNVNALASPKADNQEHIEMLQQSKSQLGDSAARCKLLLCWAITHQREIIIILPGFHEAKARLFNLI